MPDRTGESLVQRAAGWPSRHPRVVAFSWGLFSGYTFGPLLVGSAVVGYLVGKSGGGLTSLGVSALGMLAGFVMTLTLLVSSAVNSGCRSCVDIFIVAPGVFGMLLIPLGLGYWFSRRSSRPAAEPGDAQGTDTAETDRAGRAQSDWRGVGWLSGALAVPFGVLGVLLRPRFECRLPSGSSFRARLSFR